MNRTNMKDEFNNLDKSGGLTKYFQDEFEMLEQKLDDDRFFCQREIESTRTHLKKLEEKFSQKIHELRQCLDRLEEKNENSHRQNKEDFERETTMINELHFSNHRREAWDQYQRCKEHFDKCEKVIDQIPSVPITESSIDELFLSRKEPKETSVVLPPATQTISTIETNSFVRDDDDDDDRKAVTKKEDLRRSKQIEKIELNKESDRQDASQQQEDEPKELRTFASRTIHHPPPSTSLIKPGFSFSNRLKSTVPNVSRLSTTISPIPSFVHQSILPNPENRLFGKIVLDPVTFYVHEKNAFLLMAATSQNIVTFKSQFGRVDRWQLGLITRLNQQTQTLAWNDGLIISMGFIDKSLLYIFTEREFFQFNPEQNKKVQSRMLPRGNDDDEHETSENSYENIQRGIGTVYDGFTYHFYSNRKSNWVLSKSKLDRLVHIFDYPVSQGIDDVHRWIHFNVNRQSINFLVELDDGKFAVIFCSLNDVREQKRISFTAEQPLKICSAFISQLDTYVYFVNDRSKREIHILTRDSYLESYPVNAHAIYYVEDKNQLLIVSDKMIFAMNFNTLDLS